MVVNLIYTQFFLLLHNSYSEAQKHIINAQKVDEDVV